MDLKVVTESQQGVVILQNKAIWAHQGKESLELKIKNQESIRVGANGSVMPMKRADGNTFRGIGFDKVLLRQFSDYFISEAKESQMGLIQQIFEASSEGEEALFYKALVQNKLVADMYLKLAALAESEVNLQSLVIRDIGDV